MTEKRQIPLPYRVADATAAYGKEMVVSPAQQVPPVVLDAVRRFRIS
jgi:hypothetical protein